MAEKSDDSVKVLSTTAMKTVFEALAPEIERAIGRALAVSLGPSAKLEERLCAGEAADAAILTRAGLNSLVALNRIVDGSLIDIARSPLGVAVRAGAAKPDISSAEAFKQAVLAATAVAVSRPVGAGQSGAHMAKVFERLGIADAVAAKAKYGAGGPTGLVGLIVARGDADIGVQQMAELMGVPGIDIVGPLPEELQSVTQFTGGTPTGAANPKAGKEVLYFLTKASAKKIIAANGLEPN
jgi:molybdate transport system substrate-binding protein